MYILSTFVVIKIMTVIMVTNVSDHSANARLFANFTSALIFPILIPLSRPTDKPTPYVPVSSFMTLYSHLIIWGNIIILTIISTVCYVYFQGTD